MPKSICLTSMPLVRTLAGEFYIDADMIRDAIRRRASFNVVHLGTMFKADYRPKAALCATPCKSRRPPGSVNRFPARPAPPEDATSAVRIQLESPQTPPVGSLIVVR